ncbi:glycosyltransferase [Candidatus Falkowbacteria bacterium]|nr:glycosyltransferase [Candidatus Falkowbacteria bacterium]
MKICLINNLFRPYDRGGSEKVVNYIYEGLKDEGQDVFLISGAPYRRRRTDERPGVIYLRSIFYSIGKLPIFLRFFWHIWNIFDFLTIIKIWFVFRKNKPELVMTHNLKGISFLLPVFLRLMKIKHAHTLHDIQLLHPSGLMYYGQEKKLSSFPAKVYQFLCRKLFGAPGMVISPSRWLMEEHVSRDFFNSSEKFILPNPSPKFSDMAVNPKNPESKFTFLYVGQIEEHKGILFFVKAFINFWEPFWTSTAGKKAKLSIELLVAGSGSVVGDVGKIAFGDKRIKILGGKTHSEVKELMQSADCLVVPSLCYENSPTVIYEAASLGLPVLASDIGGIPELIKRTGGVLFEPGNEDDLGDKMKYVLGKREQAGWSKPEHPPLTINYIEDLMKLF